jgi:hypothetical protein
MTQTVLTREQIGSLPTHDREIAQMILKKGLTAVFNGHSWCVTGTGIRMFVTKLRFIARSDLSPVSIERRW